MAWRLSLFGSPQLLDADGRLLALPAKTYALIARLIISGRGDPVTRASLRQFLWEDSDAKTAAANMRKFLSRVVERQEEAGFALINSRRDHVELAADNVQVDLLDFLRLVAPNATPNLGELCDLYRGDLLEGLEWEGEEAQEWLRLQRDKLRDAFVAAVARRLEPGDPAASGVHVRVAARRLAEVDAYNEVAHRALMQLFADDGEPARVRDLYLGLEQRLRDDLGTEPSRATRELFQALLPGRRADSEAVERSSFPAPAIAASALEPADNAEGEIETGPAPVDVPSSGMPRITVLPPPPLAGQDFSHQVAVSLIEDVTIGLCRSKALSVVAPHTAWELSVNGKKALFRTLGIEYAVETQMQNRGGEPWLSLKLLKSASREILWTNQFSLKKDEVALQYREISVHLLSSVIEKVERAELTRYDKEQNGTAYHLYLVGQRHLRTLDLPHVRRARRAFKIALGISPDFVPLLSGLARTLREEWLLLARGDPDLLLEAERLANRALELDPDDARGYRELGVCNLYSGRFEESLEAFRQAEERNPQFADLLVDYADALTHACEPSLGLEKVSEAIKLNPLCPDYYWWIAGGSNYHLHRYAEAIDCISRMRDQSPAYRLMAASHARLGERDKAAEYVRKVKETHPDFSVSNWLAILPVRDPQYERDYEEGLREAGFE